ncbi:MAG: sulfotransferase [Chloroflexota bacterium]|nr:sulfotransferase [Chloroflexota bacterium]
MTRKRVIFLLGSAAIFVPFQLMNGLFLLLDWVFFPGFRRVEVREPVFILGNPRTGSTHLLRVLARDEETFAVAKLWELVLAPSITQRKIVRGLGKLDRCFGNPFKRWIVAWEKQAFKEEGRYRRLRFEEHDEDELILLTIFSAIHLVFAFPFWEAFHRYIFFDSEVSPAEKRRFMAFYKRCMQRTLYVYGPTKHYLSKSPANCGRVGTLCETFPDARFVYTTRNPLSMFPSTMSLFAYQCNHFSDLLEPYPFGEYLLETTKHWYRYPLQKLAQSAHTYKVVKFKQLVQDLEQTVIDICTAFGLETSPEFGQALKEEVRKADAYTSRHKYSLEDMGITPDQIVAEYQDVFERFDFDTEGE